VRVLDRILDALCGPDWHQCEHCGIDVILGPVPGRADKVLFSRLFTLGGGDSYILVGHATFCGGHKG